MSIGPVSQNVTVCSPLGLHLRPADAIVKMVTASGCKVQLECRGQTVDADSILSIVTLGAAQGSVIAVHATGESATQLVEQLAEFFENRFFDNDESDLEPNSESSPSTQG